ncbi:MAG: protein kinase [Acidobacteriota bacterium]|nr:protein kinase [Acidobacteriota bacterium]
MALAAGDRLGPYEILAPLGAGGLGDLYRARDTRRSREVAITISKEQFSERFEHEARAAAALHHPHICTLYDVGPHYLAMEWIDGVPLRGPLSLQETLRFAREICDALDYAHQRGVIHGDLRPANILVTHAGIKLMNFGLARGEAARPAPSPTDATPAKQPDARSDIYAVGCVLYEMLMGRRLVADRRPVQPAALEKVLQKCLERDPAARYPSAAELQQALTAVSQARGFRREYWVAAASIVMLVAGLALLVMQFPSNQRLSDKDILVLADFSNTTGDKIFDVTLRTALAIQLEQSPFLKIMDDEQTQQDLKRMGRPPDTRISNVVAHDICVREGQKAMINGAIADLGQAFLITVQAVNCQNGATLAREQVQADGREQVLNAISKAATGIRAKLGESSSSIQKFDRPLNLVSSGSIEAFQAYAQGVAERNQGRALAAIASLEHASQLDPNFAIAYLQLYFAYSDSGQNSPAEESLTKAFTLADRASEFERLRIQAIYDRVATGDLYRAIDTNLLLNRTYPRNRLAHNQLGGIYTSLGEGEKALAEYQSAGDPSLDSALILAYARLDRFTDAKSVPRTPDVAAIHRALLRVAFMLSDSGFAATEIAWLAGKPEEYQSLGEQSQNALLHGEFKKAAALAQQGARLAQQRGLEGAAGQLLAQVAGMGEFRGSCEAVQQIGAVAALLCSAAEAPLKAAQAQAKERPHDTLLNAVRLPVARATLALQQNQPGQAIEALQAAAPYERAYSQVPYLRGIAYLRRNQGVMAAAEFRKILDHKGANWGVVYPLAFLGAGRAWALAGDSAQAKDAYRAFFAMWQDADTDLPVLAQAQKEFAALK